MADVEHARDFSWVVAHCLATPEFVSQFNRLTGRNIRVATPAATPLERMVDEACKVPPVTATKDDLDAFFAFVLECVWLRLPDEAFDTTSR